MKQEGLKERVELLEAGEKLGYPRLGYGRSTKIPHDRRIPQGQQGWETFCAHAHIRRVLPALRIARVLRDNNVVPYHPPSGAEVAASVPITTPPSLELIDTAREGLLDGPAPDILSDIEAFAELPKVVVPLPRPKKGGHKRPPHPLSKRAQRG